MVEDMSDDRTPEEEPRDDGVLPAPACEQPSAAGSPAGTPDGGGLPDDRRRGGVLGAWRRTYGASPLHLLLHLIGIVLIAWALSQSFDAKYSAAYKNLAIWMVGGAIINDFVALPLYVGVDRVARGIWGKVRPARPRTSDAPARPLVRGNGHVRVPLAMAAVLLLVYFPNITGKAPIGHRLSTGLPEQPDFASRWLTITAGLLVASAVLYGVRVVLARSRRARATT